MLPKTSIALLLGLAALEAPAVAQQLLNRSINVQGVTRTYLVYVPSSYSAAEPAPLLFNFHGGDMTSQEMLQLSDMRDLAEADAFLLVYPQGLPEPGGGPIWNSEGPYSNGTDEMAFVGAVIDRMAADYSVDERRVYACGFSNGGNLVYDLSCLMADRFAAIAAVAGNMFEWTYTSCSPTSPTALLTNWVFVCLLHLVVVTLCLAKGAAMRLVLDRVDYTYPVAAVPAVAGVSAEISAGGIIALTGPTGCGKSTLLRLIAGLLQRHGQGDFRGDVKIDGRYIQTKTTVQSEI